MERLWKPLDVRGLRLYRVDMRFAEHPQWNEIKIVAANSPTEAVRIIEGCYRNARWVAEAPTFHAGRLDVNQPASWTR